MLISEIFNTTKREPVRARTPSKVAESTVVPDSTTATVLADPLTPAAPKMKLREFLVLQELTGYMKKALQP